MKRYSGKRGEDIIIRNAELDDMEESFETFREVAAEKIYLQTEEAGVERKEQWYRRWVDNGKNKLFAIALVNGKNAGGLVLTPNSDASKNSHVLVLTMWITKVNRGIGVGKYLMDYGLGWAAEQEWLKKIILGVYSSNLRAVKLYLDYGFRIEGDNKGHGKD